MTTLQSTVVGEEREYAMERIGVVGTGYVGLVTGTCLAE